MKKKEKNTELITCYNIYFKCDIKLNLHTMTDICSTIKINYK